MNTTITIQNRVWLPLVAAGLALAVAVGVFAYVVLEQRTEAPARERATPTIQAPTVLPQAEWKTKVTAAGAGRISKSDKARVEKRGRSAVATVQTIFDTLFLDPTNVDPMMARRFTKAAAQAFRRPGVGLPAGAEEVQTVRRRTSVSLYAKTASQATARVHVGLKGHVDDRPFRLKHEATLWLQRGDGGWKVIAYEVRQKP